MEKKAVNKVFIHVGFGRTATSYLQYQVFPNIPETTFYRKFKPLKMYTWTGQESYRDKVLDEVMRQNDNDSKIFFSDEGLIAYFPMIQLYRLKKVFPNAVIIFTLRSQFDAILSMYRQKIRNGDEFRPLKRYLDKLGRLRLIGLLSYVDMIEFAKKLFGDDNVRVFLFEEYINDMNLFAENLYTVMINDRTLRENEKPDYEAIVKQNRDRFRNKSFGPLAPFVRLMNYSFLIIDWRRYKRYVARRLARIDVFLYRYLGVFDRKIKERERKFVVEAFGNIFIEQNKRLERLINRTLPRNYFP